MKTSHHCRNEKFKDVISETNSQLDPFISDITAEPSFGIRLPKENFYKLRRGIAAS